MVERELEIKFSGDADGGKDIVGAVCMRLERNFLLHDGQHRLQLHIECGIFPCQLVVTVAQRLEKQLAQKPCRAHSRHGALFHVRAVAALGIFAEGALHGGGILQHHVIHALARELYGHKRTADHVRAARTGACGGHAAAQCKAKRLVLRVDGVDRAQLRCERLDDLVIIHALPADAFVVQANMAVRFDAARCDETAFGVNDLAACGRFKGLRDRCDFTAVCYKNTAARDGCGGNRIDVGIFNQKHGESSGFFGIPYYTDKNSKNQRPPEQLSGGRYAQRTRRAPT